MSGAGCVVTPSGERGSATVWAVSALACLMVLAGLGVHLATAMVVRHRVEAAADLAALAAATDAVSGEPQACGRARWVVERMRGRLDSCRLDGWDAVVEVHAEPSGSFGRFGVANAHARAGPAANTEGLGAR